MNWSDTQVLKQALDKIKHRAAKGRGLPNGWKANGPGHMVKGSLFDCSRNLFERLLKTYFSQLYVGWNPFKNEGQGCWEVWQKPSFKTATKRVESKDYTIFTLDYQPNDFEHHVYDLPYLTPKFIDRLREMDMWENKNFAKNLDYQLEEDQQDLDRKEQEDIKYAVRHHKDLFRQLKALAQDGYNPFWFFSDHRQGNGQV